MRLLSSSVLASLLGLLALTACSIEPFKLGSDTTGVNGKLSFQYSSSQCGFGCSLDRPVVLGSMITVQVRGVDASVRHDLRVSPAELGTVTRSEECTCESTTGNSSKSHPVDATATCAPSETKSCVLSADIQTLAEGNATLLVVDPAGATVDSASFAVSPAERVDSAVTVNGVDAKKQADGTYSARAGDHISVHSVVYSGAAPMVFTEHGLIPQYSDMAVLSSAGNTGGATDVEEAIAKNPGTATLTMQAHGAAASIDVRVTK